MARCLALASALLLIPVIVRTCRNASLTPAGRGRGGVGRGEAAKPSPLGKVARSEATRRMRSTRENAPWYKNSTSSASRTVLKHLLGTFPKEEGFWKRIMLQWTTFPGRRLDARRAARCRPFCLAVRLETRPNPSSGKAPAPSRCAGAARAGGSASPRSAPGRCPSYWSACCCRHS